jgi:uncharacterized delta-60 repeat protein
VLDLGTRRTCARWSLIAAALAVSLALASPTAVRAAAGDLDPSFSGDGKLTTSIGGSFSGAYGVAIDSQGRIVAVGYSGSPYDFTVVRYNPNGSLDTSFSGDGVVTTPIYNGGQARAVAIDAQGRIVVAGFVHYTSWGLNRWFGLVRYNPNGSLDTSFDGDGKLVTSFNNTDFAYAVTIDAQGRIIVAGETWTASNDDDFALARYNPNGSLDTTFSGDGKVTTPIGTDSDSANGVAVDSQGRIVAAGESSGPPSDAFAVARYKPNGSLDTTFSGDGKLRTTIGSDSDGAAVAIDSQDRVVVGGSSDDGSSNWAFAAARYNPNGSLDTSFSSDGTVRTVIGNGAFANAVGIDSQGRIVVGGWSAVGGGYDPNPFAVARYNPNGSLDTTFSGDGVATTEIGSSAEAEALAVDNQDRIVLAGESYNGAYYDFALARHIGVVPPPDGTTPPPDGTTPPPDGTTPPPDGTTPPPDGTSDTTLEGIATAKKTQKQRGRKIKVKVRIIAREQLTARARGKIVVKGGAKKKSYRLKAKSSQLADGEKKTLTLKPKKRRHHKKIHKALKRGKKVRAKLRVKLVDTAGNAATERLRVKLLKG